MTYNGWLRESGAALPSRQPVNIPMRIARLLMIAGVVAAVASKPLRAYSGSPVGRTAQEAEAQQQEAPEGDTEPASAQLSQLTTPPEILAALKTVRTPSLPALARALAVSVGTADSLPGSPSSGVASLGDLDDSGQPEVVLKWRVPEPPAEDDSERPLWELFLLAWDGSAWQVSQLMAGAEEFSVHVIHLGKPSKQGIAVVTLEGPEKIPAPEIFQVRHHRAELVWDSGADESRYEGHRRGHIEFREGGKDAASEMIETGLADPGLLVFGGGGQRGFTARAVYRWDGKAYIPGKVEYSHNRDYALYRFIAALHLRDFRSAYALVDPAKFLGAEAHSEDDFRQYMEEKFPEFLDDEVFEAREPRGSSAPSDVFVLPKSDKVYVYHPTFSTDGKLLLTGLERTEEAPSTEDSSH